MRDVPLNVKPMIATNPRAVFLLHCRLRCATSMGYTRERCSNCADARAGAIGGAAGSINDRARPMNDNHACDSQHGENAVDPTHGGCECLAGMDERGAQLAIYTVRGRNAVTPIAAGVTPLVGGGGVAPRRHPRQRMRGWHVRTRRLGIKFAVLPCPAQTIAVFTTYTFTSVLTSGSILGKTVARVPPAITAI